jgi:hypothetical protein
VTKLNDESLPGKAQAPTLGRAVSHAPRKKSPPWWRWHRRAAKVALDAAELAQDEGLAMLAVYLRGYGRSSSYEARAEMLLLTIRRLAELIAKSAGLHAEREDALGPKRVAFLLLRVGPLADHLCALHAAFVGMTEAEKPGAHAFIESQFGPPAGATGEETEAAA